MQIRTARPGDYSFVYSVVNQAFNQKGESGLIERLRKDPAFIPELSLVAELDNQVVGHILFSRLHILSGTKMHLSLALAPISVLPAYQKQGIGKSLMEFGLQRAKEMGETSVIVLGHPAYYPKFGFKPSSIWGISCPLEVPDNAFMALELKRGCLEGVKGMVKYADAFGIG